MIKLVAIDMDGTLLNSRNEISQENQLALARAKEAGIRVVIATGRAYDEAVEILNPAGIEIPVININGAQIHSEKGELLHSVQLDYSQVKEIHEIAAKEGLYHELFADRGIYPCAQTYKQLIDDYQQGNLNVSVNPQMFEERIEFIRERVKRGQHIDQIIKDSSISYFKFVLFSNYKEKLERVSYRLKEMDHLAISSSFRTNIEINHKNAQKGKALEVVANQLGVPLDQTMAIGDNWNDLSMFQVAGLSVAMGNAEQGVAKYCDQVTKKNDEHGVAFAFEKWVL